MSSCLDSMTMVVQYEALGMEDEEEVAIRDIDKPSRLAKVKVGRQECTLGQIAKQITVGNPR